MFAFCKPADEPERWGGDDPSSPPPPPPPPPQPGQRGSVDVSEHGTASPPVGSLLFKAGAGLRLGARPQHLCVFGPTGGTGQAVVRMALSRGWAVTAFARQPERLAQEVLNEPKLRVVEGDVRDSDAVATAVKGHSCVVVCIGSTDATTMSRSGHDVCSEGTKNIIAAMKAKSVKRLVVVTAMGASESAKRVPWSRRWMMKYELEDKTLQETHVRASGLEFVLVRPVALNDGENRGGVGTLAFDSAAEAPPTQHLSRVDLAAFLIDQCASNEFLGQAPGVSWLDPPAKK